ncbi:MAG: glycosyltransferase family 4 protein [Methylacidiphilales bacterium]|nr:glycosyltransferase family 4 protein [Candidatus Methylacidiphilales bacterium]
MRILQLTPGTGNYYCGSCLHDNSLVRALRVRGHEVLMVPLYLPHMTDEPSETSGTPIFLSGISVFLEQKYPAFRHMPDWLNRMLSSPALLRLVSGLAGMTSAKDLGESAVSMLQGAESRQAGEVERLIAWLRTQPRPDVISLSNSLLSGLARRLKEEFRVPIICTLQGEDSFLDGLPEPYRKTSWNLLAQRCADIDHFVPVSHYYGELMSRRLGLKPERVTVVHPGIAVEEFSPVATHLGAPVIGFLARMHQGKGLGTLADAFLQLEMPGVRLRIAGAKTSQDERFVRSLQRRLPHEVEFLPNLDIQAKREFLRGLSVLSVPTTYGEALGLYVLEAWASGVPVVQPRHGAFPELVGKTGGGLLCDPDDPAALAAALRQILRDPAAARRMGEAGRLAVHTDFSIDAMTQKMETLLLKVSHAT